VRGPALDVFLARQPILDSAASIDAYEPLIRLPQVLKLDVLDCPPQALMEGA
jgi:hypothetical protein